MHSRTAIWLAAIRPKTLPLACSSIFLGSGLALAEGQFSMAVFLLSVLTATLLQILSNLANDYGDALSGADNAERQGPLRVVQSGLVSQLQMKQAIIGVSLATIGAGLMLLCFAFAGNWLSVLCFVLLGAAALAAAITYTVGRRPYGYVGLGDLAVFLFFGWLGVLGSYYLYTQTFNVALLLPATACGLLATAVLNINNIRDINTDSAAGKRTLVVQMGRSRAVLYHYALILTALLCTLAFLNGISSNGVALFCLVALLPLLKSAGLVSTATQGGVLNRQLANTARASFIYNTLLAMGLWVSAL